jgi:hypothetical protein
MANKHDVETFSSHGPHESQNYFYISPSKSFLTYTFIDLFDTNVTYNLTMCKLISPNIMN